MKKRSLARIVSDISLSAGILELLLVPAYFFFRKLSPESSAPLESRKIIYGTLLWASLAGFFFYSSKFFRDYDRDSANKPYTSSHN